MTKSTYRELTTEELEAITLFAKEEGRMWKATLAETYWYNARIWYSRSDPFKGHYGTVLHGLRNSLGPRWLDGFKLPKP